MKEATGEASMTGITIAIIAVVVAIAVPLVSSMVNGLAKRSCCTNIGGTLEGSSCVVNGATVTPSEWWDSTNKKCVE